MFPGDGEMANEAGKKILEGLGEARRFFGQVSLLLQSADGLLGEAGWECFSGNRCVDLTGHIHRPNQWMPQNIYRYYGLAELEDAGTGADLILFVGVLLDREGAWSGFQEPWLTFGLYQFLPGKATRKFRFEEWVEAPLEDKLEADGQFHFWDNQCADPDENEGLMHTAVAAIPLLSVQGAEELKRHVVDPLLGQVQNRFNQSENSK